MYSYIFKICNLQASMVVSWGPQECRGLVIRVVAIDYKFCHRNTDNNMPGKLSEGKLRWSFSLEGLVML